MIINRKSLSQHPAATLAVSASNRSRETRELSRITTPETTVPNRYLRRTKPGFVTIKAAIVLPIQTTPPNVKLIVSAFLQVHLAP